ncbi:MAG: glycosyltransferase [candidate division KSB1 bacterium]|nr:glycosyltransferase [candidate division KSB1 bacterium]MDZ7336350.1 glycosyltransferase [candidate division KSB1 bacterium]MDZ7356670.1 glycosyltransferase [candidate division KSB1 bacterium]MDZ7376504.1 glycosyltransferase [candidate division KSB1 bacterium]MDZ7398547.1 glycosyltransferase [candidate division KSB1 bacterium]
MDADKAKNGPTVSVIIPTYNRANWLAGAIESVLVQSYQDLELILIDDGSTDETPELVAHYGDRIRYYAQDHRGPAAARNLGIQKAQADLIAFLDSDDRWLKDKLQAQVDLMLNHPEIKICYTDEIWIRRGVRVNPKKIHQKYSGWIYQRCLPLCIISPSSVMIRREVFDRVGLFDEQFLVCEDYEFWLRISHRFPITFINQPLIIKYGGHQDQLSRQFWGMDRFRVMALEKMLQDHSLSEIDRNATIQMLIQKCNILINGFEKRGKTAEGDLYRSIRDKYRTN